MNPLKKTLLILFLFFSPKELLGAESIGKEICNREKEREGTSIEKATDPCFEAEANKVAKDQALIQSTVYAASTAVCALACYPLIYLKKACSIGTYTGSAVDVYGAYKVSQKRKELINVQSLHGPIIGLISSHASSCKKAIMNAAQSVFRFSTYKMAKTSEKEAYKKKAILFSDNGETFGAGTVQERNNHLKTSQASIKMPKETISTFKKNPESNIYLRARSQEDYAKTFDAFEEATGKSAKDLFRKIASGTPPLEAAFEMSRKASRDDKGLQNLKEIYDAGMELSKQKIKKKKTVFANTNSRKKKSSGVEVLPSFQSLLEKIKAPKKKKNKREILRRVSFSKKMKEINKSHYVSRSLFEKINDRYRALETSFMSGKTVTYQKRIPRNIYLSKIKNR